MNRTCIAAAVCIALCTCLTRPATGFEPEHSVYPADSTVSLRFVPKSAWAKKNFAHPKLKVSYVRDDRRFSGGEEFKDAGREPLRFKREAGAIVITLPLRGEHEHSFAFYTPKKKKSDRFGDITKFSAVYTLRPDLFALRPLKGEIHQPSQFSPDGKMPVEQHIRYAREAGFDFIAVTDHFNWDQNPVAIAAARDSGSGLTVYPGEEIHNKASLHSICLGAPHKMSQMERTPEFAAEWRPIFEELRKECPSVEKSELQALAESLAVIRRAKASGAMVIYSHPFWKYHGRFNSPFFMSEYILAHNEVDAVEIVNGDINGTNKNSLTEAWLYELAFKTGKRWPVVSASDCHNVSQIERFRRNYNVILGRDCSLDEFRAAVTNFRSVAAIDTADRYKKLPHPVFYGPLRICRFAYFLYDSGYWKKHDRLTKKQAALIAKYLEGDKSVVPEIKKLAAEIDALREALYAPPADGADKKHGNEH